MPLWIAFTLMAALMQAIRTACQKTLAERSSSAAATLARSLFALPLAWGYLALVWQFSPAPELIVPGRSFYFYTLFAAAAQIIATVLMVSLFSQRNYAIGICYAKTEALIIAVLSLLLLNEALSLSGWFGVLAGSVGIILLIPQTTATARPGNRLTGLWRNTFSRTTALGLSSGLGFALTSMAVRQAGVGLGDQLLLNAAITLAAVISLQTLLLGGYMLIKMPAALTALFGQWKLACWVGLTSVLGSIGWFSAMILTSPALVKTLGQIEFLFVMLLSQRLFKERLSQREWNGIVLIIVSVICILQPY